MAGKANSIQIAERYALALLELGKNDTQLDHFKATLDSLTNAVQFHTELNQVINSPLIPEAKKLGVLNALLGKLSADDMVLQFVKTLSDNKRLPLLVTVVSAFNRLLAAKRGEVSVQVWVAQPLDKAGKAALDKILKETVGKNFKTELHEDPSLLGGMVVQIGSKMLDASLKSTLERYRLAMKGA